jgi:hypothetical protein
MGLSMVNTATGEVNTKALTRWMFSVLIESWIETDEEGKLVSPCGGSQRMEYGSCAHARMLLKLELARTRGAWTPSGFRPVCAACGQAIQGGFEMHEVLITRAAWRGLPEELIMVRENCVLVQPCGKGFGSCHMADHTEEGSRKCVRQLLQYEGCERVMAWLEGLRNVAVSGVVEEAVSLVRSWSVVN